MKKIPKFRVRRSFSSKQSIFFVGAFALIGGFLLYRAFAAPPDTKGPEAKSNSKQQYVSNELLIKIKASEKGKVKQKPSPHDTGIPGLNGLNQALGVISIEPLAVASEKAATDQPLFQWYKVTFNEPSSVINNEDQQPQSEALQGILKRYKAESYVEEAEPNFVMESTAVPNDPYFSSSTFWGTYPDLWGLKKINAETAWDQTTGSASILVADIDTGVDYNHDDLKNNMWVNSGEVQNNGADDDRNGYVDDYLGWDFHNNDNNPMDDQGHGTHTVGTIAATGNNNAGVVGVNWTSKIMPLKFLSNTGSGSLDNGIKALQYAADMGARVSSNSWGCACSSVAMDDAVKYEHDRNMVVVAAAGNNNSDTYGFSPANADMAITVAASGQADQKACFSNWGEKIDVAAPGGDSSSCGGANNYILSTRAANSSSIFPVTESTGKYAIARGTSMAAPHVAGLAALVLAKNPSLTTEEVRQILRTGSDDIGTAGKDREYGYGRINAFKTISQAVNKPITPVITQPKSRTTLSGTSMSVLGYITGPNFTNYKVEVGAGLAPTSWTVLSTSTDQPVSPNSVLATFDATSLAEGQHIIRVTATDTTGKTYQFQVGDILVDNFDVALTYPSSLVSLGNTEIFGTATTKNGLPFGSYKLEWSTAAAPTTWQTTGITLTNPNNPVQNGKLGTWDTSTLTHNQSYNLRLTASSSTGVTNTIESRVTADKDIVAGWPKYFPNASNGPMFTQTFADLNNDGIKEIIIPTGDGVLHVFRKDGSYFPGFPKQPPVTGLQTNTSHVNVADMDNDGDLEIIYDCVKICIVRQDGSSYPGWPNPTHSLIGHVPAVADLNGDGTLEIVIGQHGGTSFNTATFTINAYRLNGTQLTGFPKITSFPYSSSGGEGYTLNAGVSGMSGLSVADVDKDGKPEIAWSFSNRIYLHDNSGNILPGWPYIVPNYGSPLGVMVFGSTPTFGDVFEDGKLGIFTISSAKCALTGGSCGVGGDSVMYGFNKDGSLLPGYPKTTATDGIRQMDMFRHNSPAFADIDGNGTDELIASLNSNVMIYDANGKRTLTSSPSGNSQTSLSDVDGDGQLDYISTFYNTISISKLSGTQFSLYWRKIINHNTPVGNNFYVPPVVADLDNNGMMELGGVIRGGGTTSTPTGLFTDVNATAYLWEIPAASGQAKFEWPQYSRDMSWTANVGYAPPVPTPDTTPPSAPTNLIPTVVSGTQVNLSWAASTDDRGAVSYEVYRNNNLITTVNGTTFGDTGLTAGSTYSYYVIAKDESGNKSAQSVTVSVTTLAEPTSNLGILNGIVTDPNGVPVSATISITVNGKKKSYSTNSNGAYYIPNLPEGTYSIKISANRFIPTTVNTTITGGQTRTLNITLQRR